MSRLLGMCLRGVALGKGDVSADERLLKGDLAIFERSEEPITFEGGESAGATFVLGSAVPYPHHCTSFLLGSLRPPRLLLQLNVTSVNSSNVSTRRVIAARNQVRRPCSGNDGLSTANRRTLIIMVQ